MTNLTGRPWVFLDVDGPLIPFRARPTTGVRPRPGGRGPNPTGTDPRGDHGNPLLDRLDPADGPRLLALGCPLVWATTWAHEANEVLAPRLGLPTLPVVAWPDTDDPAVPGLHWKTPGLVAWAAGHPFVWLDDEITDTDRWWVAAHHPAPALLHRVDARTGLTTADYTHVHHWLGTQPDAR